MHHSRLCSIMIDCRTDDLEAAAKFWSRALGRPYKPDNDGKYMDIQTHEDEPIVMVQRVEHESRVHLDIESDDLDAEATRLEALGAKKIAFVKRWWVMEAPTGQRFCIVRMKHPERGAPPNEWP